MNMPTTLDPTARRLSAAKRKRIPIVAVDYQTGSNLNMTCQVPGGDPQRLSANDNLAEALVAFGDRRRIYANALQARSIERQYGLPLADRFDDVSIMARLLDEDWPRDLSALAATLLDEPSQHKKRQTVEAVIALCSKAKLRRRIQDEGLEAIYRLESDVIDPTVAMMHNGILVDANCLNRMAQDFGELATSSQSKTARHYAGLRDTAKRLLRFVDQSTGRIHCTLDPLGTATGRFSCARPALQAVPPELKRAFIAGPNHVLIEADFSQIELRVLAHFSRDPAFLQAYSGGDSEVDLHRRTAALALGIDEADVTVEQRNTIGKAVNFAIIYGQTPQGLAATLDIDPDQAQDFIDAFFAGYPAIRNWQQAVERQVIRDGQVRTLYGRRRYLPDVWSRNKATKQQALRRAVNTIIQGTAADINKLALARLYKALPSNCRLLLTVHDSVLLEVPKGETKAAGRLVRQVMQAPPPDFSVPLVVAVRCGRCWAECQQAIDVDKPSHSGHKPTRRV